MFKIPPNCREYMAAQVTQYADDPLFPWTLAQMELSLYRQWLPKSPKRILDLGCGLGRTAATIHQHYSCPRDVRYFLADSTRMDKGLLGEWEPSRPEWCNDLERSWEFVLANGMQPDQVSPVDLLVPISPLFNLNCDLIISTLAVGFHWRIEPWLKRLSTAINETTVLIFGVRHGKYNAATKFDGFDTLGFAESGWKQDFLALRCTSSIVRNPTL